MQVRNLAKSLVIGAALLGSSSLLAMGLDGVYVLGGVGYTGLDNAKFGNKLVGDNALEADGDFSWRAGAGVWLWDNFGLEFNYQGLRNKDDSRRVDLGGTAYTEHLNIDRTALFDISGIGRCFFTADEKLWGFARAGVAYAHLERETTANDDVTGALVYSEKGKNGMGAVAGLGVQYDFVPAVGVRLEGSTIQALNNNDSYSVTANVVVNLSSL